MQVVRFLPNFIESQDLVKFDRRSGKRVSNTWIIYLRIGDNLPKGELIPNKTTVSHETVVKGGDPEQSGPTV